MTSWPFTDAVSEVNFEQSTWGQKACALGNVSISSIAELDAKTLLRLSEQEAVESRLISYSDAQYHLEFGPFESGQLGPKQMLMVQNLESHLMSISDWLSQQFAFLPRWRIEDVMASYGNQDANCGAHFDQYSVFLVQLSGTKCWSIDVGNHIEEELEQDSDIRILKNFTAHQQFNQQPGDVLYIPPGVGHHGIASDDCITLSIGIRNPLQTEMASHLVDRMLQQDNAHSNLDDGLFGAQIDPANVAAIGKKLLEAMLETDLMQDWYGCFMTELKDPDLLPEIDTCANVGDWLSRQSELVLNLPSRIAVQEGRLFINGECLTFASDTHWLLRLQQQRRVSTEHLSASDLPLIEALLQHNALRIEHL